MMTNLKYVTLVLLCCFSFCTNIFSQCSGNEPIVFLGNDTILCPGQSLNLSAPNGYDVYLWSTGQTTSTINVNTAGTYIVEATVFAGNANLVVNGNFEAGNSGFTSSYGYAPNPFPTALWDPGFYAVGSSPNDYHSNFYDCADKTSGTGLMYIANGSSTPNTIIWSQTITVVPNTNYNFSAWVSSVENTTSPAVLQFFVNGSQIGSVFSPSDIGCTWGEFFNLWNSGVSTSAVISIVNQNTEPSGNDFAIDEISFIPYCTNSDTIEVSYDPITVDAGQDFSFCSAQAESMTAVSSNANATFLWSTNETTATITPTISDMYYVSATNSSGCSAIDSVQVTINPTLDASFSSSTLSALIPFTIDFDNSSSQNVNYSWFVNDSLILSTTVYDAFSYAFTEAGTYSITLLVSSANGCPDSMQLTIVAFDEEFLEPANIFTPDADGINDTYQFRMANIKELSLSIFNRWGQEVKQINEVLGNWDGKDMKGNELTEGIYFYTYNAVGGSGTALKGQGFIQLVR